MNEICERCLLRSSIRSVYLSWYIYYWFVVAPMQHSSGKNTNERCCFSWHMRGRDLQVYLRQTGIFAGGNSLQGSPLKNSWSVRNTGYLAAVILLICKSTLKIKFSSLVYFRNFQKPPKSCDLHVPTCLIWRFFFVVYTIVFQLADTSPCSETFLE